LNQKKNENKLTLPVSQDDHKWGPMTAAVTLVEYGDYECTHSRQAYAFIRENRQRLGDRLCFVFRNFPVSQIHAQAQHAAEAAEAAGAQNRFWEMHDKMFANQQALANGYLVEYADGLGLDTSRFLRDMSSHAYAERVREDFMSGMQSGVNGTPTFFINGVRHDGPWDVETLLTAVEKASAS
jgi:protein-disulfide isomerase